MQQESSLAEHFPISDATLFILEYLPMEPPAEWLTVMGVFTSLDKAATYVTDNLQLTIFGEGLSAEIAMRDCISELLQSGVGRTYDAEQDAVLPVLRVNPVRIDP